VPVGSITTLGLLGSNSIGFTGHLGRRRLRPGKYTVTLTALNSWGQRASHKLRFRIRR
jgi:hypothetical protein